MRTKATFMIGFGTGYVLGAKAGRQRYEQIMRQTRSFLGKPAVQDATSTLKHQAGSALGTAKKVVTDKVGHHDGKTDVPGAAYATVSGSTGRIDPYPS
ncbi:MAG TPA: hypothetical protein VNA12_09870 [Mycobacteriales bacterium]|nr:hypothetical protein [Mycobacteriales bacterium]